MTAIFRDRIDAGTALAAQLLAYKNRQDVLVLALPRGGVPVAFVVAEALRAPLDVLLVRKLGVPGHEELAMGAIASGGIVVLNDEVVHGLGISQATLQQSLGKEQAELARREQLYRGDRPALQLHGRTVIVIDDGLATGSTMQAAVAALKPQQPSRIVVAVPVGAKESCAALQKSADEVVCVKTPQPFYGVGQWYDDFSQTTDQEVRQLLSLAAAPHGTMAPRAPAGNRSEGNLPIPGLSSETREPLPTARGPRG